MLGDERPEDSGNAGNERTDGTVQPKARRGPKPGKLKASPGLDMAAVFELIGTLNEQNQENFLTAIQELKKPSAKELREEAENDKKEKRLAEIQLRRMDDAKKEEARKASAISGCSHSNHNLATGLTKHTWRAQVHTPDGVKPYFVPTCMICNYQIKDNNGNPVHFPASTEMLTNGVNLDQYVGLDLDRLKAWYKQSTEQVA